MGTPLPEVLRGLFPGLSDDQVAKFEMLEPLYREWNAKVNLVSRKDIDHFAERHLLHSLALGLYWKAKPGERVIDIGTGGGFPGIPLAILYPDAHFTLVDSIGKKIAAVCDVQERLSLNNVVAMCFRAEMVKGRFHTGVTRAVARLAALAGWCTQGKMGVDRLWCLKGGDLREEVEEADDYPSMVYSLAGKLDGQFFETKKVVMMDFR
jgi:16S rRNA (guanine527-N7)-methyltransferase